MRILISVLLASSMSIVACSHDDKSPAKPPVQTYFVNGDPMEMLEGAHFDKRSPFNATNIYSLNDYGLVTLQIFKEREKKQAENKTDAQVENENKPTEESRTDALAAYREVSVRYAGESTWEVGVIKGSLKIVFQLDQSGEAHPVAFRAGNQSLPVKLLHWSQTPDKKVTSFLVSYNDPEDGKGLFAFYFERKSEVVQRPTIDKRFLTLDGPGAGTRWQTPELKIQICGAPELVKETLSASSQWQGALGERLRLNVEATSNYAPFSDLNQHCIHMLRRLRSQTAGGFTATIMSPYQKRFIDSDIFIYGTLEDDIRAKYGARGDEIALMYWKYAMAHEMGHMLGLDHKFDGTPSMMSYSFKNFTLTDYDREAIQALYDSNVRTPEVAKFKAKRVAR